ncbi:MAG: TonB-dependent receptor plug domain-containing protein [Gemmatimonadaceae bacterium]|nr:TonB-dependent receptor plug domain-containing protein [Gemmatimonadaceae bacterium]
MTDFNTVPWSSITSGVVFSLVISTLVLLAALAAHDAQRAARRPVRWVWMTTILVVVALSAAAPLRRDVATPLTLVPSATAATNEAAPSTPAGTSLSAWLGSLRTAATAPISRITTWTDAQLQRVPVPVHRGIALLWLSASIAMLGVFGVSYVRMRRRVQQWPVHHVGDIAAHIAPSTGPAVIGVAPSEIILPSWLLARPEAEQRAVVMHEQEHVRAGDPWLLLVGCVAVAVMPWHPVLWYALNRLRLAIEVDCDRRVLRRGIPAASYGALLIDLSAMRSSLPSAMPAFSCSGSYLERRLRAMTSRPMRFAGSRRIVGATLALGAIVTACESKLPTSAEIEGMNAATAAATAGKVAFVEERLASYIVDGKPVSAEVAKAIPAGQISEVEIVRRGDGNSGVIKLRTKAGTPVDVSSLAKGEVVLESPSVSVLRKSGTPGGDTGYVELRIDTATVNGRSVIEGPITMRATNVDKSFDGLLVVDGVITDVTKLKSIAPESIKSVNVLKGASAQALSGSRGANGVIQITTKAGK